MIKPFPYKRFLGLYNKDNAAAGSEQARRSWRDNSSIYLSQATNVDIDQFHKLRRREGYSLQSSGSYRDLSNGTAFLLAVKNDALIKIDTNPYTETVLISKVDKTPMVYTRYLERDYFSNQVILGYAVPKVGNRWVFYPTNPDYTDVSNTYYRALPAGELLESWNGRLLVAINGLVIFSEVGADYYDVRADKSFWHIGGKITMMKGVTDGVYISNESRVYFFGGMDASDVTVKDISPYGAYKGSAQSAQRISIKENGVPSVFENSVIWASKEGICVGGDGGRYHVFTDDRYIMPGASSAAGVVIQGRSNKSDKYIVSLRN